MKNFSFVIILMLLIIGGYFAFQQRNASMTPIISPTPQSTIAPSATVDPTLAAILKAGGSSYREAQGLFTILYPSDYRLDTQDPKHPRIYKTGATQRGQTEMYDGVIIVFESATLNGQTLSAWVDVKIKTLTADGTVEITSAKTATTINNYSGFTFRTRGLGEATYFVIQKDANSQNVLVITTAAMDPQNKGYQKEIDATLSTLELLK